MADEELICFLSHKCGPEAHQIGLTLRTGLQCCGVSLLRDPFNPGEDVRTKIETQLFDSFVFLYSAASWESVMCQHELETARIRGVPVITVLLESTPPEALRNRLWVDVTSLGCQFAAEALRDLSVAIRKHAEAYRAAYGLNAENLPEETRKSAQFLFDRVDPALIADHLPRLAASYRPETDILTRYWIALCVGKVGSPRAGAILKQFQWENEPLPREGIRQAHNMLSHAGVT